MKSRITFLGSTRSAATSELTVRLGSTGSTGAYFLSSLLPLAASANFSKRRIASEREGLSLCCLAHESTADLNAQGGVWRTPGLTGRRSAAFFRNTGIDFSHIRITRNQSEPMESGNSSPALTQATEVPMAEADCLRTLVRALSPDARARASTNLSDRSSRISQGLLSTPNLSRGSA